jgi:hypothetical protein
MSGAFSSAYSKAFDGFTVDGFTVGPARTITILAESRTMTALGMSRTIDIIEESRTVTALDGTRTVTIIGQSRTVTV